ncbi:hypothetical protein [Streptomyces sp. N2A]|uniref:hypothetical protein n=1 Tax=Streptomyces sp. N2A TaxID=3073936 RepID=UPI002870930A|nr:hypothetical protein [Streptomyces sp. N2A]
MGSCLQGDLTPAGERVGILRPRTFSAHPLGNITLQSSVVATEGVFDLVPTVFGERDRRPNDVPVFVFALRVLQRSDSPFSVSEIGRRSLQCVRRILRVQRTVLQARAEHLRACGERLRSTSVPVLLDVGHSFVQQIPHTAVGCVTSKLVMHIHPMIGYLIDLVRLRIAHHGLQRLKRLA